MRETLVAQVESKTFLSYVIFPFMLALGLFCTWYFSNNPYHPISVAVVVSLSAMAMIAMLERLMPYRRDWNVNRGDVLTDLFHTVIHQVLLSRGLNILWAMLLLGSSAYLAEKIGSTLWPHHWPILGQLVFMLVVAEFGRYWMHRLSHRNKLLWRLHAVHHSPERLYFFNAGRVHPLEKIIYIIPEVVPFIILGTNVECLALYATFNSIQGLFQHANINVRLGPLNYFFSMSQLHRWHHSDVVSESDHNFGNNLSVWDVVFGTWYLPKGKDVGPLGLLNKSYPTTFWQQVKAPFQSQDISKPNAVENTEVRS